MLKTVRTSGLLFALSALAMPSDAAFAASAVINVNAKATKPLALTSVQDMDFGTIALAPGTWSGATVSISRNGQFTCPGANLICTGPAQVATYTVNGSNDEVVRITAPNVVLTSQSDPSQKLIMVVDSPGTVTLANAGKKGTNFSLGGSITLSSSTGGGVYAGTFDVTVDYD